MITAGVCMGCGGLRRRGLVEITEIQDVEPRYIEGMWAGCCGWPVQTRCSMMRPYGVPVPTPEDLLRGAGLYVGLP